MSITKISHLADIHIRKIPTRKNEYENVFNNLFKSLKKEKPDRIVIVGDLGHNYLDLGTEQLITAKKLLKGLAEIAPVRITRGNHDFMKKNSKRIDAVGAIVELIDDPNILYYNKTGFYYDDDVVWAVWHHGEKNNNPWKSKKGREILLNRKEDDLTYIDLFHDPINGCISVSGFEMKKKSYYKLKDFLGDYSFLGDIHKKQYFDDNKRAYCGSLIAQDFGEGDDQFHGYLLWNIKNGDVKEIPIFNNHSFKNIKLTPFTDFDDLDYEIDNPTEYMKIRIIWSTLPSTRNKYNENKIYNYIKTKYPNAIISQKNDFVVEDVINVDDDITLKDITNKEVQHEIFEEYLDKIGVDEKMIKDIIALDDEITNKIVVDESTNIEWSVIKFGGKNFMSYQNVDIDWRDKDGLYQITGINTAGKTTILKLLSYILFGKTLETETRKKYGDSRFINNRLNVNYCEGYMVIEANGEYYGIKRRTEISRKKNGEISGAPTKVWYYALTTPDDELNDENNIDILTEDNRNKTQKRINQIIGSYDNYMRIVMTTSDTLNRILSNDMSVFIDSLLFDSGLDVFDKKLSEIKEYQRELNHKSRITCNEDNINTENKEIKNEIKKFENEIKEIELVQLPNIKKRIKKGNDYIEMLMKKIFKIDPEIATLNIDDTQSSIRTYEIEIKELVERKNALEKSIKLLKNDYDEERLNELIEKRDKHKENEYTLNLKIKEYQQKIDKEEHEIEILNGKIHVSKQNGLNIKNEIKKLKESKTCPMCGQLLTADHQHVINENVNKKEKEMFSIADDIKKYEKLIENHKSKIGEYKNVINSIKDEIKNKTLEMENILKEIGKITNDKNDVEKRRELSNELIQIPIKIENKELKKLNLQKKIDEHNKSKDQIEENKKIEKSIDAAKLKLESLRNKEKEYNETIIIDKNKITDYTQKILANEQLIIEYKKQEYQDRVIELYKKCVHRDGIPRQLLSNYIIPKINVELENMLSVAPFKVWLDVDDLRPKLAYYDSPNAIIDAISSSGKERTFASVVLKSALNEINIKSKPTIFLLDEVMGKLDNEGSVEEFIQILQIIKMRCKKFLIIEHVHEVNPDYIITVTRNEKGISKAIIE